MMKQPSVLIIGAGIIGLSIGWQLARDHISVSILEQRLAGKQASWAAAGMLAPYWEASYEDVDLLGIGKESLALYPRFLEELTEDSNMIFPREHEGTLCVGIDGDDREWLHRQYTFKQKNGMPVRWLSGEEARQMEPLLSPRVNSGVWIFDEKQVNNRLLLEALKKAFLAKGGKLVENVKITKLVRSQHPELAVQDENGRIYHAEIVINAAGAWASRIHPMLAPECCDIQPIKGQILSIKMQTRLLLRHMIRTPRIYLAPKCDGVVRVGATSEDQGFSEEVTAGAALELLQNAWEVVPAISECAIEDMAVGLRPFTADHKPLIGASALKGVYHAIGHGRSGILLAPYTAYLIKKIIMKDYVYGRSV